MRAAPYCAASSSDHIVHDVLVSEARRVTVGPLQDNAQTIALKKCGNDRAEFLDLSVGSGNVELCVSADYVSVNLT